MAHNNEEITGDIDKYTALFVDDIEEMPKAKKRTLNKN